MNPSDAGKTGKMLSLRIQRNYIADAIAFVLRYQRSMTKTSAPDEEVLGSKYMQVIRAMPHYFFRTENRKNGKILRSNETINVGKLIQCRSSDYHVVGGNGVGLGILKIVKIC
jgi:hypothetical protein